MGTFTAHMAVGFPNEGGMIPTHVAWLWENHRPAWLLEPTSARMTGESADRPGSQESIRWIPEGSEHILEDGLLLLAMHARGDPDVLSLAKELAPELVDLSRDPNPDVWDVFHDLQLMSEDPKRVDAFAQLRELSSRIRWPKLIVTVLEDSSLERQLPVFERYSMDLEVCTVSYSRLHPDSVWGTTEGEPQVRGSLKPRPDAPGDRYTEIRI